MASLFAEQLLNGIQLGILLFLIAALTAFVQAWLLWQGARAQRHATAA